MSLWIGLDLRGGGGGVFSKLSLWTKQPNDSVQWTRNHLTTLGKRMMRTVGCMTKVHGKTMEGARGQHGAQLADQRLPPSTEHKRGNSSESTEAASRPHASSRCGACALAIALRCAVPLHPSAAWVHPRVLQVCKDNKGKYDIIVNTFTSINHGIVLAEASGVPACTIHYVPVGDTKYFYSPYAPSFLQKTASYSSYTNLLR